LIPHLSAPAWAAVSANGAAGAGGGIVFAFLVIYVHSVRGLGLGIAGLALAAIPAGGLLIGPLTGTLADRIGPGPVIAVGAVVAGLGTVAVAFAASAWHMLAAAFVLGIGMTAFEAPVNSLLATSVLRAQRSAVFAVNYTAMAAGWGVGGLLGGFVLDIARPASFELWFSLAALPYLTLAVIALRLRGVKPAEPVEPWCDEDDPLCPPLSYRTVFADRTFLHVLLFTWMIMAFAMVQFDVTFPAVVAYRQHLGPRVIGLAFGANTLVIVFGQLVVLRLLHGWRRTRALIVACGFASLSWLVVLLSGHASGTLAAAGLVGSFVVFAFAEMTWSPSLPGLVNDLSPGMLRGRYNAMSVAADAAGRLVGPAVAGFMLQAGLTDAWLATIVVVCAASALVVLELEHRVPAHANRIVASGVSVESVAPEG
jgi:MFS family permease